MPHGDGMGLDHALSSGGPASYRTEIHHAPWSLQPVDAEILRNTISTAAGIARPAQPALTAYGRRLDVVVRWPRRLEVRGAEHPSE